jgi:hypothetical protein
MTEKTQALEGKADRSRERLTGLIDDLQSQITPRKMLDQVLGITKVEGSSLGHSITQQISKHPLPYLLIAAGVGWLMLTEAIENGQQRTRNQPRRKDSSRRKGSSQRRKPASK